MREITFYRTSTGYCPVEKFLDLLPSKHSKKVSWVLSLIEDLPMVPKQYFKKLVNTDDIWEVRVKSGGEAYRLLGSPYKTMRVNNFNKLHIIASGSTW